MNWGYDTLVYSKPKSCPRVEDRDCILCPGGGLFIRNLNDMWGSPWNQTSSIQEVYRVKQTYMYYGMLENGLMYLY